MSRTFQEVHDLLGLASGGSDRSAAIARVVDASLPDPRQEVAEVAEIVAHPEEAFPSSSLAQFGEGVADEAADDPSGGDRGADVIKPDDQFGAV